MLDQTGMQSRPQRQYRVIEIVTAVVQRVRSRPIGQTLTNAHVSTRHHLQHERKIFAAHARHHVTPNFVFADQMGSYIGHKMGFRRVVDCGGIHTLIVNLR